MKRITAIEKKEIKKKRRIKVKLKTNKGLQEGIFIFFNLLLAAPITERKNTKCLIRQ